MLDPSDIKKLFAVLQARYGHRFASWLDDPEVARIAVAEWHRELKGFRPEDIRRGLESVPDDWPPTLPQFAKACLPDLTGTWVDDKVQAEYRRRLPSYYWEPDSAREAARRKRVAEELFEAIVDDAEREILELIREHGTVAAIADAPAQAKMEHAADRWWLEAPERTQ